MFPHLQGTEIQGNSISSSFKVSFYLLVTGEATDAQSLGKSKHVRSQNTDLLSTFDHSMKFHGVVAQLLILCWQVW